MPRRIEINSEIIVGKDQPSRDDLRSLAKEGFRSVVDLRTGTEGADALTPSEEAAEAEGAGLSYVNIAVDGAQVEPSALDRFRQQVQILPKPIFLHCASGKRSGSFAMVEAAIREKLSGEEMLRRADSLGVAHGSDQVRKTYRRYVDDHLRHPPRASGGKLPPTTSRVQEHSPEKLNRRLVADLEQRVRDCAKHPERIDARLEELDREWDMERTLETNAATLALVGTLLGAFVSPWFLIIPAMVTSFLLQHALRGWCPPVPLFRRRGVRTADEIARERTALKVLRGDLSEANSGATPVERADHALAAALG